MFSHDILEMFTDKYFIYLEKYPFCNGYISQSYDSWDDSDITNQLPRRDNVLMYNNS